MASVKTLGRQQQSTQRNQLRNKTVALKGKLNTGPNRVNEVVVTDFKVHSENENISVDENSMNASVSKGDIRACGSDSKASLKNMEKSKGKSDSSKNLTMGRKALADVTNVSRNICRNAMPDVPKPLKFKCERSAFLQRVSLSRGARTVNVSSKSLEEKGKASQAVDEKLASQRGSTDIKASSNSRRIKTMNISQESVVDGRMITRSSLIPTRKSLPVFKRLYQAHSTNSKESAESSGEAKKNCGFPVKDKVGKKAVPHESNTRSHIRRNRASDGFIVRPPRTNVDARALLRKSIKPIVKTTVRSSNAQRTLKPKSASALNKSKSAVSVSSKKVEEMVTSSVPENIGPEVSHESTKKETLNVGNRKCNRRRSYTSLLMARSKLLEGNGEVMQEKLPNIDDGCNELDAAEYVDDIYQYYWVAEAQQLSLANYMSIQTEITPYMRGILINWLIEVHSRFDLMQETLYLMVTVLDQYLSLVNIEKNEMQLVGITSLLLASKYEDFWHPRVKDLISISAECYTRNQVLQTEKLILRKLKFRLNTPTPYVFMLRFLKAAQSDIKLEHLAFYLIELCLVEYEALKFRPSLLCASAIYVARCTLKLTPAWTPLLGKHAHYDLPQIRDCAEMILRFQKSAKLSQLDVTYRKYTSPDLSGVANIKPLDIIPF